jgi:hypothetical protein
MVNKMVEWMAELMVNTTVVQMVEMLAICLALQKAD